MPPVTVSPFITPHVSVECCESCESLINPINENMIAIHFKWLSNINNVLSMYVALYICYVMLCLLDPHVPSIKLVSLSKNLQFKCDSVKTSRSRSEFEV